MTSRVSPRRSIHLVIWLVTLTAALGGCASEAAPNATTTATVEVGASPPDAQADEKAFVRDANAICEAGNQELAKIIGSVDASSTDAELEVFADDFVANVRSQVDGVAALPVPASISSDIDAFLTAARAGLADVEARGATAVMGREDPFASMKQVGRRLGLTACGSP